jgi:hypothetical protein
MTATLRRPALPARLGPVAGVVLAAVVLAQFLVPGSEGVSILGKLLPELCPWAAAGAACPGCGTTRSALHLLRGEWGPAWRMQPAVFLFAAALLAPLAPLTPERGRRLRLLLGSAGIALALTRFLLPA